MRSRVMPSRARSFAAPRRVTARQRQQQVLGADVVVAHGRGLVLRVLEDAAKLAAHARLGVAAVNLRPPRQIGLELALDDLWARADLCDDLRHDPFRLLQQRQQQVLRLDLAVVIGLRELLGGNDGLLAALGEFVESHDGLRDTGNW